MRVFFAAIDAPKKTIHTSRLTVISSVNTQESIKKFLETTLPNVIDIIITIIIEISISSNYDNIFLLFLSIILTNIILFCK